VDEASAKSPGGALGHKVYISREVCRKALPGLIGMPINARQGSYDEHSKGNPIGTILRAGIDGKDVWVEGVINKKYHPQEASVIRANKDKLGLSYEIGNVAVADESAAVWHLTSFTFEGASVLLKTVAAYGNRTSIAARRAIR